MLLQAVTGDVVHTDLCCEFLIKQSQLFILCNQTATFRFLSGGGGAAITAESLVRADRSLSTGGGGGGKRQKKSGLRLDDAQAMIALACRLASEEAAAGQARPGHHRQQGAGDGGVAGVDMQAFLTAVLPAAEVKLNSVDPSEGTPQ